MTGDLFETHKTFFFFFVTHTLYNILCTYMYSLRYGRRSRLFDAPSDEFTVVFSLGCHSTKNTPLTFYLLLGKTSYRVNV